MPAEQTQTRLATWQKPSIATWKFRWIEQGLTGLPRALTDLGGIVSFSIVAYARRGIRSRGSCTAADYPSRSFVHPRIAAVDVDGGPAIASSGPAFSTSPVSGQRAASVNAPRKEKGRLRMYNLLKMSSQSQDEWEQNQGLLFDVSFLNGRVFEHTDEALKEQFTDAVGPDFDLLMKLPCLFTYEGHDVVGSIGRISKVRSENRRFEIAYSLPSIYPRIRLNEERIFQALGMGTNRSFERGRTHWAVKDVDLFDVTTWLLHEMGNLPVVLSEEDMNRVWGDNHKRKPLVFLSHRASYRRQVAQVREQLEGQGLRCFLAHEDVIPSTIWQNEILNALNTMDVFIGFVTDDFHGGGWPDQEVGYAYQRGVPRVFIKLEGADPIGMVAREQALTTSWEHTGQEIIAHLKQATVL